MEKAHWRLWLARLLIGLVTAWNLQAALTFWLWPAVYAPGFELSGVPGAAAVRGVGLLFLMWNLPYLAALWQPRQNLLALKLALAMQLTGLVGESWLLAGLTAEHAQLQSSLGRFIAFDAAGLSLLTLAFWLARPGPNTSP
jgi:hypothetical protein